MTGVWTDPTYLHADLPSAHGSPYLSAPACSQCGTLVMNTTEHTDWHYQLWLALGGAPREP